jgi:hypothetical protein
VSSVIFWLAWLIVLITNLLDTSGLLSALIDNLGDRIRRRQLLPLPTEQSIPGFRSHHLAVLQNLDSSASDDFARSYGSMEDARQTLASVSMVLDLINQKCRMHEIFLSWISYICPTQTNRLLYGLGRSLAGDLFRLGYC